MGNDTMGLDSVSNTSLAKRALLNCIECKVILVMSGLSLIVASRGSSLRAYKRGERGHPCLVLFDIIRNFWVVPGLLR